MSKVQVVGMQVWGKTQMVLSKTCQHWSVFEVSKQLQLPTSLKI